MLFSDMKTAREAREMPPVEAEQPKTDSGLLVSVYRHPCGDATNRGASAKTDWAVLIGEDLPALVETENPELPGFYLRIFHGRRIALPVALPVERGTYEIFQLRGWMFGGNFLHTSDSRFPSDAPIHIYDRREDK
jgi:hypothetical protein